MTKAFYENKFCIGNMKKKVILTCAALMLGWSAVCAQNVVEEACDTLNLDDFEEKRQVEQVPLSLCQRVEPCENTPFAIVTKDGKKGIYNMKKQRNVTPIAYESLKFFRSEVDEWGVPITFFEATRGHEKGRICVQNERDDIVVEVWHVVDKE